MKLFNWNYFTCEPFELNFRLHVIGGLWPLETQNKWKKLLFAIYSYACFFSLTSIIVIQMLDLYLLRSDLIILTRHLCIVSIAMVIVSKCHLYLYRINLVQKLKNEITMYKETRTDPTDIEILEKSNRDILTIVKTFYLFTFPSMFFWIFYPAWNFAGDTNLIFPYRLPVEEWTYSLYVGVYAYQSMAILNGTTNVLAIDSIFCGFIIRICAHYDILMRKIQSLDDLMGKDDGPGVSSRQIVIDEKKIKGIIKECVRLHEKINWELNKLAQIFSACSLVHVAGVTLATGAVVTDSVIFFNGIKAEILQRLLYLSIVLWNTFLYCYFGSRIKEKSYELSVCIYSSRWYEMNPSIRRDLLLLLLKSQKNQPIRIAGVFVLEMRFFAQLLNVSYNYISLFYQLSKKRNFDKQS